MEAEYNYRKQQLFDNIGEHKLVMQHLHYPDWHQHLFFSNEDKDRELYEKMDKLAGEILGKRMKILLLYSAPTTDLKVEVTETRHSTLQIQGSKVISRSLTCCSGAWSRLTMRKKRPRSKRSRSSDFRQLT